MENLSIQKDCPMQIHFFVVLIFSLIIVITFSSVLTVKAQQYTRGIGIYPGDKSENFSPSFQLDKTNYRNIALRRPAYQSSSYDYNLTAQLITDGIKETKLPDWIVVTTSNKNKVEKHEREWILDRHMMTRLPLEGPKAWIQIELAGNRVIPILDSINLSGSLLVDSEEVKHWEINISGSDDSINWQKLGTVNGDELPGDSLTGFWRRFLPKNLRMFNYPFKLSSPVHYRFYRADVNSPNALSWNIGELAMFNNGKRADVGGPYSFTSVWKSEGNKTEWVYVDLGAECSFDKIVLYWIHKAKTGAIQVSNDALNWKDIQALPDNSDLTNDIKLDKPVKSRYVRVLMNTPVFDDGYILSEMEVFGTGGPEPVSHSQAPVKDGKMYLDGGAWKLQRSSLINTNGETLSSAGFNDKDWLIATVPATILTSYLNAGTIPDPNYADNQVLISESFFYSDFWYRDEFTPPSSYKGKRMFLNFDGINWKAEVYLNGHKLGRIEGAFTRGKFDVTNILIPGGKNILAVRIEKNDTPGFVKEQTKYSPDANGGELGADNPTFHASIGWDWIPTIRGRNTGIWNDVYISASNQVTIEDPFVSTDIPLPDTSSADINIEVILNNHSQENVSGTLRGKFGKVTFEQPVTLQASETKLVKLNPKTNAALKIKNPKLWWPNGYGQQNLYKVEIEFISSDNKISDTKSFMTGIRKMTYSEEDGKLKIWINGRRFVAKGGNWGFPESMLRYRGREYDIAVRYHKEMNFTMIRNWVGQTGDDEFYEACDKYGIMIWQDFWLANPLDGPDPNDSKMFLQNAEDYIKRIRNHPSLGLYCGRNEGNPPEVIDNGLRKLVDQLQPDVHYISNSAFGVVSGGGPYRAMPVKFYFEQRATEKLHSEIGMPNIVSYESLKEMMPESDMWPKERMWGIHDFCLDGAQGGNSFNKMIEDDFGSTDNLKDWLTIAQWINYQGYRAMFEAQSKNRMGALLWMSHPAWPSLVWQTYDYYFEPTAAYFGCKKACEPLHIQWNPLSDSIEVVNYSEPNGSGLTAIMQIINLDGKVKLEKKVQINSQEDSMIPCFGVELPEGLSKVFFIRLRLERKNKIISENFYWRGLEENNFKELRNLPKVKLNANTNVKKNGDRWNLTTELINNTNQPALMVKLKVIGNKNKERILPVIYSDNYVSLMPGEKKTIIMELQNEDTQGEKPDVVIEGFNIK
jgi:Glycosyl hydrolase 2 galactose-binding domain-like/Exo-beta-D-glucosaminidase Ig-fold domain/Glycosyl hydrolases family 2/NedA-like, galactose-binding domain